MTSDGSALVGLMEPMGAGVQFGRQHIFTVDVEEWFQVGAFEKTIARDDWPSLESRVERQIHHLLELMGNHGVKGTFFCLGWVAERHPLLIRAIHKAGHEIGCHGMNHQRLFTMDRDAIMRDIASAKAQIEDALGEEVLGYRAPNFSITPEIWWVYECFEELGIRYSSSLYPVKHDHYGMPEAPRAPFWPIGKGRVLEVPMSVCTVLGRALPASGGGYFRLMPASLGTYLFDTAAKQSGHPSIYYMHPWEIDPDQPFVADAPWLSRFRHYTGQRALPAKLERLWSGRNWATMKEVFLTPAFDSLQDRAANAD